MLSFFQYYFSLNSQKYSDKIVSKKWGVLGCLCGVWAFDLSYVYSPLYKVVQGSQKIISDEFSN